MNRNVIGSSGNEGGPFWYSNKLSGLFKNGNRARLYDLTIIKKGGQTYLVAKMIRSCCEIKLHESNLFAPNSYVRTHSGFPRYAILRPSKNSRRCVCNFLAMEQMSVSVNEPWNLHRATNKTWVISIFQIRPGRAYLAFTEYDRKSGVGTVAFKDVEDVAYYRAIRGLLGSSHLVHYHMVHGQKPILGDWKIFTGESVVSGPGFQARHGSFFTPEKNFKKTVVAEWKPHIFHASGHTFYRHFASATGYIRGHPKFSIVVFEAQLGKRPCKFT